ncbi:uncharacterized protein LOC106162920 [Lingula anatina]|uniref:Uncharacterized protein LOC106162920 n=1 Tax=Lingula anatina TaxID=7574 RepID=A0A1S3IC38_LINAN|nr:uncharacterized protein LOC106162920 [Lingula anatina]|eukprot:XP_013395807.1 uncharacterized protein LOC106162920 [Lingula anatina]
MVMSWTGSRWWVVTEQELFNGGPRTRIKRVFVGCSGEFFQADLGSNVTLLKRGTGEIIDTPFVYAGGLVTGDSLAPRGYFIVCHAVPMTVSVYLHTVEIEMTGKHCASALGVRGICGDYNGNATNDYDDLIPPGLPPWKPFLLPERP